MSTYVRILKGKYRNAPIMNTIFPLVKDFTEGATSNFITVNASAVLPETNASGRIRITVDSMADFEFVTLDDFLAQAEEPIAATNTTHTPKAVPVVETDEEVMARIADRFSILHEMTIATIENDVRAMIVTGPPGVGKSFGIEQELDKANIFHKLRGPDVKPRFEIMKGTASAIGLYQALYNYSDKGSVIVFDDCDSVLFDELSLNILKAALDSGKRRRISWNSESNVLEREGIPKSFDFKGSVIFITNLNFDDVRSRKLKDHLAALQSRCHYLDLSLDTERDKLLRIKQIAATGELFSNYNLTTEQEQEIIDFMDTHKGKLRELSLRMALKIADLVSLSKDRWQLLTQSTCMVKGAIL